MMDIRYEAEELDEASLEYLREVRRTEGRGMPGVYLSASHAGLTAASLPVWAAVGGPVLVVLTLFLTWGSLLSPTKTALLMTAGLFVGGWMFVAWVRCLVARSRPDYIGHFKYVDALYLWYGTGRGVWVTPISMLARADLFSQRDNEGNYKKSTVTIHCADGKAEVTVKRLNRAQLLEAFLNELAEVRSGTPAERGYLALERAGVEGFDEDEGEDDEDAPRVDAIPEPHRARSRSALGLVPYAVMLGLGLGLFFACRAMATVLRDDAMFDVIANSGAPMKHSDMRAYLQDPRNTRHREEMLRRLAAAHEQAAAKLQNQPVGLSPEVLAGLRGIVVGTKDDPTPLVTVRFTSTGEGAANPSKYMSEAVRGTAHREMIKLISDRLAARLQMQDFLDFAESESAPAMIEVDARYTLPKEGGGPVRIDWKVTFQASPDAAKSVADLSAEEPAGADAAAAARRLYRRLVDKMLP